MLRKVVKPFLQMTTWAPHGRFLATSASFNAALCKKMIENKSL
jgi:hypothetical protein